MGELKLEKHWQKLIIPSCTEFFDAEDAFINATMSDKANEVEECGYEALRTGMAAAIFLYHFVEVARTRNVLSNDPISKKDARKLVSDVVSTAEGILRPDDHSILGELAVSFQ